MRAGGRAAGGRAGGGRAGGRRAGGAHNDINFEKDRDMVCMARMISTVYEDDSDFGEDFWSIWRLLESILGPFGDHFALMLGHLGVLEAKMSKSG